MALDISLYVLLCDLILKRLAGVMLVVKVFGSYFNVSFVVVKKKHPNFNYQTSKINCIMKLGIISWRTRKLYAPAVVC